MIIGNMSADSYWEQGVEVGIVHTAVVPLIVRILQQNNAGFKPQRLEEDVCRVEEDVSRLMILTSFMAVMMLTSCVVVIVLLAASSDNDGLLVGTEVLIGRLVLQASTAGMNVEQPIVRDGEGGGRCSCYVEQPPYRKVVALPQSRAHNNLLCESESC